MNIRPVNLIVALALFAVSAVLLIDYRDAELIGFRGLTFGIITGVLGLTQLVSAFRRPARPVER